jgi:hypothetical protein
MTDPPSPKKPPSERRVWVRYLGEPGAKSLLSESWPGFSRLAAKVRDVGHSGVNLIVEEPLSPGTRLLVDIPRSEDYPSSVVLAHLAHTTNLATGEWLLACNFVDELSDEDLKSFGAPVRPALPTERRSGIRHRCSVAAKYRLAPMPHAQSWQAEVVNVAVHSLGLLVAQRLQIGTMIWLEVGDKAAGPVLSVRACVARISLIPDQHDSFASRCMLGCRFLRELTEHELHICRGQPKS